MAKYEILSFNDRTQEHRIRDIETGGCVTVDLFVDATFEPNLFPENVSWEDAVKIQKGMIGKIVKIQRLEPCTYFACNCKLIEK